MSNNEQSEDPVLRKIRKCLALATSSNPAEAEAAMRQAQKLMQLHGVDQGALNRSEVTKADVRGTRGQKPAKWENMLVWAVCEAFGAHPLWTAGPKGGWKDEHNGYWTFIAPRNRVELVVYAYTVLTRQVLKARAEFLERNPDSFSTRAQRAAEADAFTEGMALALRSKVRAQELTAEEQDGIKRLTSEISTGEVVESTNNGKGSAYAMYSGLKAGAKAHFYKATEGTAPRPQLTEK
jgi:Protein of unknown function (DUF2786)